MNGETPDGAAISQRALTSAQRRRRSRLHTHRSSFGEHCNLARVTYNREWTIPLIVDERGESVRETAFRLQIEHGRRVRFAVALRIRDERDGRMKDIVRYDDRGGFHRHAPGFPPKRKHEWITLRPGGELDFIEADLDANADSYEQAARRSGFEVTDDDEPEADFPE